MLVSRAHTRRLTRREKHGEDSHKLKFTQKVL